MSSNFEVFILIALGTLIVLTVANMICISEVSNSLDKMIMELRIFENRGPYLV